MFDLSSFYLPTANAEPQGDYYCYFCRYSLVSYNMQGITCLTKRVYLFIRRLLGSTDHADPTSEFHEWNNIDFNSLVPAT